MRIPQGLLEERDARMYEMHKAGMSYRAIAAASQVSPSTAHAGVTRVRKTIAQKLFDDNGAAVIDELERLDDMQRQLWPMTRPHKVETGELDANGEMIKITIPPSFDAVDRVLKIMDRRAKLRGLDQSAEVQISLGGGGNDGPAFGAPESVKGQTTAEEEARNLLEVALKSGVIDASMLPAGGLAAFGINEEDVIEAEVVGSDESGSNMPVLERGAELGEDGEIIPPPWMEDDDGFDEPELPDLPWAVDEVDFDDE